MWRGVAGVVGGGIVWQVVFFVFANLLVYSWAAYGVQARTYMDTGRFEFTVAMSAFNILFWILAEVFAGWIAGVISRSRAAVWALAALLTASMAFMHLYVFWYRIPWWYNIAVVITVVPAVLLGGELAGKRSTPKT